MKRIALLAFFLASTAQAADLAPQTLALAGITPSYNSANAGGDTFSNDGRTYVHLKNGSGGAITVTFDAVSNYSDNALGTIALADSTVVVPAAGERIVGFLPPARFNSNTGKVGMTYTGVTSLTVAVVKVGKVF